MSELNFKRAEINYQAQKHGEEFKSSNLYETRATRV